MVMNDRCDECNLGKGQVSDRHSEVTELLYIKFELYFGSRSLYCLGYSVPKFYTPTHWAF